MATRSANFAPVPNIPHDGISSWQYIVLNAIKNNVDVLTGAKGSNPAITVGTVSVQQAPAMTMQRVTALGSGYTISGVGVPSIEDYTKLVSNVQQLANDVAVLRSVVNSLITQIKG